MKIKNKSLNPTKMIALVYATIILVAALLLMLPISSKSGQVTPFLHAVFTATSATCVTGLVIYDTYTHWSGFGQLILLILIQIGGIGFMTVAISAVSLTKKKIGLKNRYTMAESVAIPHLRGVVKLTKLIVRGTLIIEGIGALLLSFVFVPQFGFFKGIYFGIFHSISAFCNAGMDLMGIIQPTSSFVHLGTDVLLTFVLMVLIILGGLGFFVWNDILEKGVKVKKYTLHTKVVLLTSLILVLGGGIIFLVLEFNGQAYENYSTFERVMLSLFHSVSTRTAGFNTVDLTQLSDSSVLLTVFLMVIGGSPGSTAGGIKTTTVLLLGLSIFTVIKRKKSVECFGRRIDDETLRQVCAIITMYTLLVFFASILIMAVDNIPMKEVIFETASAVGTVGLSLGITSSLSGVSHFVLILLMYFGRVGGISVLLALTNSLPTPITLPQERIAVG